MRALIEILKLGRELDDDAIAQAAQALLSAEVEDESKAEFLIALREKGETSTELAGFVRAFLTRAVDPQIDAARLPGPMLDICGTGGDRMDLFNVSTTSMFVLAAGGAVVVKHGNRAITSKCGGADVLESLGVRIDLPPGDLKRCVEETGAGFMFAPHYHPAFKAVAPVRRKLAEQGITTVFNMLGPLLNPAQPPHQLIGVFAKSLLPKFAEVLALLNRKSAWAVHGSAGPDGGVDELSTMGPTEIHPVQNGHPSRKWTANPVDAGLASASIEELRGGTCEENARILEGILDGSIRGPKRDVVLLNAAAGLVVASLAADLPSGVAQAAELIDSGRAVGKLNALRQFR